MDDSQGLQRVPKPTHDNALEQINGEIINLLERQQAVVERLQILKDRLFGETPETSVPEAGQDHGPGKIGSIRGVLNEAHGRMGGIESLIDELSHL